MFDFMFACNLNFECSEYCLCLFTTLEHLELKHLQTHIKQLYIFSPLKCNTRYAIEKLVNLCVILDNMNLFYVTLRIYIVMIEYKIMRYTILN